MGSFPGKEKHKVEADGILGDGVSHYQATEQDIQQFAAASDSLSKMQAPVLHDAHNPASRMFVAREPLNNSLVLGDNSPLLAG